MALLELKNVNKVYEQGETIALHGISLVIEKGEFTVIFGPPGSGKTTLLNLISCLDPPSSGEIYFDGTELSSLTERDLDQHRNINIGYISEINNFYRARTVYQNLEHTTRLLGEEKIESRVLKVIDDFGLNGLENRWAVNLNDFQKKKLALAMLIIKNPLLVLVDEPTLGLDSKDSDEIMEIMVNINETKGTTFIFTTADKQIIDYAYRIIGIKDGIISNNDKESDVLYFRLLEALLSSAEL